MLARMEKRFANFDELGARHMESIDALIVITEKTNEEQKKRNREKRKEMIDSIDDLLNSNGKNKLRLAQYQYSLEDRLN